ncbi:MAG TPA: ABC transporter ATP-binding protein [Acidobacteriota bacterium]|nr:ABC transporter ATP-binding protein [Acidobacteriota bacterium]HOB53105.1 ABC transporter ATP-binding protein [Acidobacteriota bacterium]HQM63931.1 ABC transporter ATP-binding protein [Acidobacteriota bacterium]
MSDFLTVTGLDKGFPYGGGRLEVLRGVTFSLPAGTTASIIGDSGSGKSTLLHVVGGMEPPDAGRVLVGDSDLYTLAGDARARFRNRQIGFVFQFHHLLPEFSALENLMMPLLVRGVGAAEASAAATALIAELGLDHRTASRPGELSGGEQQRVAVGRALITEPALLLMDEPTGNLDHGTGDRTMELVLGLTARRGTTVLLVTHNPSLADRCAERFRMTEGRLERI